MNIPFNGQAPSKSSTFLFPGVPLVAQSLHFRPCVIINKIQKDIVSGLTSDRNARRVQLCFVGRNILGRRRLSARASPSSQS